LKTEEKAETMQIIRDSVNRIYELFLIH